MYHSCILCSQSSTHIFDTPRRPWAIWNAKEFQIECNREESYEKKIYGLCVDTLNQGRGEKKYNEELTDDTTNSSIRFRIERHSCFSSRFPRVSLKYQYILRRVTDRFWKKNKNLKSLSRTYTRIWRFKRDSCNIFICKTQSYCVRLMFDKTFIPSFEINTDQKKKKAYRDICLSLSHSKINCSPSKMYKLFNHSDRINNRFQKLKIKYSHEIRCAVSIRKKNI